MRINRNETINLVLLGASWLLVAWYWPRLPYQVPQHWGIDGNPNAWMPMPWGGLFPGFMTLFIYLLMSAIPYIDPRAKHWDGFKDIYPFIKSLLMGFSLFVTFLMLSTATTPGQVLSVSKLVALIGILYILLGNFLPKVRSNFFIGIRTPWTLSSESVWYHTHRLAGKLFILMGILVLLAIPLSPFWQFVVVIGTTAAVTLATIGYSYWLYIHLPQGENDEHIHP